MDNIETSILIEEEEIQQRIWELAAEINQRHTSLNILTVFPSAAFLYSDLLRKLVCKCVTLTAYRTGVYSPGEIGSLYLATYTPIDAPILLVLDVVDSGRTWRTLLESISPSLTVETLAFLRKRNSANADLVPDYVGFDCPNESVAGYGLDYFGFLRDIPSILKVQNGRTGLLN